MHFMVEVNRERAAKKLPPYRVVRGSDLSDLIVEEYLANPEQARQLRVRDIFVELGLGFDNGDKLAQLRKTVIMQLCLRLITARVEGKELHEYLANELIEKGPQLLAHD
jgi:hypothetical protein